MDALIARLQEGGEHGAIKAHLESQKALIQANAAHVFNTLPALDPARHSLAWLYLL